MPGGPHNHDELRIMAAAKIASGFLPRDVTGRLFAGYGDDQRCSVCDQPIQRHQIDYEVELNELRRHFHLSCHAAWRLACNEPAAV
jgi:hypothetical protein